MEDEAEEEDEGILSDVHVSPNAPITIQGDAEEGKQRDERDTAFVTRFTFRLPVCGQEIDNAETPGQEVGRILELDEQGDIVVSRRKPRRRIERVAAVTIVHSLSVPLSSVGLQVWRGSLVLADYVVANEERFRGCSALELGAGVGLVGIVMTRAARNVWLTDYSPAVLENCKKNVDLNSHLKETSEGLDGGSGSDDGTAMVRCLDWTDRYLDLENVFTSSDRVSEMEEEEDEEDDIHLLGKYREGSSFDWRRSDMPKLKEVSVILAADVIYEDHLTDALFGHLRYLLHGGRRLYLSIEKRINFTLEWLEATCKAYDHFRSLFEDEAAMQHSPDPKAFVGRCIPLEDIPQHFEYERVKELEIWEIWLRE